LEVEENPSKVIKPPNVLVLSAGAR